MQQIVIVGNGIAGITAARFIRKLSDHSITVISAETDHFFSRTALMYIYMGHMTYEHTKPYENGFWPKNRIDLVRDYVEKIDKASKKIALRSGKALSYDHLILATGSQSNTFGWPGQNLKGVQGLYSYQDLELMEANTENISRAVVLGGGLIGVEMAEMLHSRHIPVTYLIREKGFSSHFLPPEEANMVSREIRDHGIDLHEKRELAEILGDENGQVRGIITNDGAEIPCQFVGLTVGVHPNIDLAKASGLETDKGILVNQHFQTSHPDIYAVGDCAELKDPPEGRRPIEPIWYTGRIQGKTVAHNICGQPVAYDPGIWFNSAKFFDIEYQVYGDIKPKPEAGVRSLYWEDSAGKRSIRINYRGDDERVIGFNLMGIRYRQEVCEHWIKNNSGIRQVLENLGAANFDPEFFRQYEADIVAEFNRQNEGNPVTLKRKRGLFAGIFR